MFNRKMLIKMSVNQEKFTTIKVTHLLKNTARNRTSPLENSFRKIWMWKVLKEQKTGGVEQPEQKVFNGKLPGEIDVEKEISSVWRTRN